jgi:hypothetical protein
MKPFRQRIRSLVLAAAATLFIALGWTIGMAASAQGLRSIYLATSRFLRSAHQHLETEPYSFAGQVSERQYHHLGDGRDGCAHS